MLSVPQIGRKPTFAYFLQRKRLDNGEADDEEYDSDDDGGVSLNGLIFGDRLGEVVPADLHC